MIRLIYTGFANHSSGVHFAGLPRGGSAPLCRQRCPPSKLATMAGALAALCLIASISPVAPESASCARDGQGGSCSATVLTVESSAEDARAQLVEIQVAPPPFDWDDTASLDGVRCVATPGYAVQCPDPRAALRHAHTLPLGAVPQLLLAPGRWVLRRALPTITRSLALLGSAAPDEAGAADLYDKPAHNGERDLTGFDAAHAAMGQGILQPLTSVLDASGRGSRILDISGGPDVVVVLENLLLEGGAAAAADGFAGAGGAIRGGGGPGLRVTNCALLGNTAHFGGGGPGPCAPRASTRDHLDLSATCPGIYTDGVLELTRCALKYNTANCGGGAHCVATTAFCFLFVAELSDECRLGGLGLYIVVGVVATVHACVFHSNHDQCGGQLHDVGAAGADAHDLPAMLAPPRGLYPCHGDARACALHIRHQTRP
eukprot:SAG11_NODE_1123_length_5778_cov_4.474027_5_plen_431_part_00